MGRIKELLSRLSPTKRQQAQAQLGERLAGVEKLAAAPVGSWVSDNQRRIWALQRAGAGAAYTISCAYRIEGPLNVLALRRALRELLERHEILRTGYMERAGELIGSVHPATDRLCVVDTRAMAPADRVRLVDGWVAAQSRRAFRFDGEPMLQIILHVIDATHHVLHIAVHHIVCDQWSLEVIRRDLFELYDAALSGSAPQPGKTQPTVPAYSLSEADRQFWIRTLNGLRHYPDLPFDRMPEPETQWQGERRYLSYGSLGEPLEKLAAGYNCTPFHVLLSTFAVAYWRWTGSRDTCIGTRVAGRAHEGTADAVGFFVNMLPIRLEVPARGTVRELLEQTRNNTIEALERERTPFEAVLNLLACKRDAFLTPLTPVTITHQNIPTLDVRETSGLKVSVLPHHNGTAKVELDLAFEGRGNSLELALEYRTGLFDWSTIERLIGQHKAALAWVLAHPDGRLEELEAELAKGEPRDSFLHGDSVAHAQGALGQRFALAVAANGPSVALWDRARSVTFDELDELSLRLAAALVSCTDVAAEQPVAIYLTPGMEWIIAALGCLRAGIPYLALDPAHPGPFCESIRQVAQCRVFICRDNYPHAGDGITCLPLTSLLADVQREEGVALPDIPAASSRTAYFLYTSGSTGAPKIVPVPHRALSNCIDSMLRAHPFEGSDVVGMRTNPVFAPGIKQWLGGILSGRPVVLLTADVEGAGSLARRIEEHAISRLYLVPSQIRDLVHHLRGQSRRLDSVRVLTTGGEPLSAGLWDDVRSAFPNARLLNNYGCSELADITFSEVGRATDTATVGRPIDNCSVYVLSSELTPVSQGTVGQIFVAGEPLGHGYFGRPDLTAAAYLPDPLSLKPGARIFCTGDYGRLDGARRLVHLGRRDQQLKINGCRVDAEHVASVIRSYTGISQALALAKPGRQSEELLVAYVSPRLAPADVVSLRRFLLTRLPHHMQPSAIVPLEAFPLLANGKIDRLALPPPSWDLISASQVAPRSLTEQSLAAIWKEVLEIADVGVDDNFFDLGGHSILAIRVLTRIKSEFDVELSQAAFFQSPTIAELAALLDTLGPQARYDGSELGVAKASGYREGVL
jgi:amino acid adenylation domain-containing protein